LSTFYYFLPNTIDPEITNRIFHFLRREE